MPPKKTTSLPADRFLLIVESPSKCKKIEDYLGPKYRCISSKGHIRTVDDLAHINTADKFQIQYTIIPEKADHVKSMAEIIRSYRPESIFLATDDDREGEAIAWHICQVFSLDVHTTKRIVFREITQPAILNAVANPTKINLSLVYAQQARQVLDLVVGFKISPLLWKHVSRNKKSPLSAGRCQTPALRLVKDHDDIYKAAIASGVGQAIQVHGTFTNRLLPFQLSHSFDKEREDKLAEFLEQSKTFAHQLTVGKTREAYKSPPKPFNTSRLLQTASQTLKMSPKTTMGLAQILYQSGLITYMRTDCQKYSRVFLDKAGLFIQEKYGFQYVGNLTAVEIQDATMPHEGIRCTNLAMQQFQHEDTQLVRLYQLIWRNTVESCMQPFRYNTTDVSISAPLDYSYVRKVETPIFLGWHRVSNMAAELTDEQSAGNSLIFYLTTIEGPKTPAVSWTLIETRTVAEDRIPPHYTEASLIQKLEDAGIGRPSTFSSIVETIQERGYVKRTSLKGITTKCIDWKLRASDHVLEKIETEKIFGAEKDKLVIQPTGLIALEFLVDHFDDCFSYGYTKTMEETLDSIATLEPEEAEQEWFLICREVTAMINERSKELAAKHIKPTFPLADTADYVLVFSSFGASLKRISSLDDELPKYVRVKPEVELDLEYAKRGEYTFAELAWRMDDGCLGVYSDKNLYLKRGKFGLYAEWGDNRMSMKALEDSGMESQDIQLEDVIRVIEAKETAARSVETAKTEYLPQDCSDELAECTASSPIKTSPLPKTVLRELRPDLSIRKGKYGAYIYYKNDKMDNPEFYPLKQYAKKWSTTDNAQLIAWIENTYHPGKPLGII